MGAKSKIAWTNDTWNPWQGCRKVSTGCLNCYMFREKKRYGQNPEHIHRSSDLTFYAPLKKLKGPIVFVCSWSDFFIEEADEWRPEAWDNIRQTPHLFYLILTKRPLRIRNNLPIDWAEGYPNVGLGVSVENNKFLFRVPYLQNLPAQLRFISCEPLLYSIVLSPFLQKIDWVITGGESGPANQCRLLDPVCFHHIKRQCEQKGIAYFHKQNGGNKKIDGSYGGDLIYGKRYHEFPKIILDHQAKYTK